ncbi:MAG: HEAT repeat domain-containing protein [Vampirovibrio sp.]
MQITIQKKTNKSGTVVYVIPGMSLLTPEGEKLIPNPNGLKPMPYEALDNALSACHKAGYDATFDGTLYPQAHAKARQARAIPMEHQQQFMVKEALQKGFPILLKRLEDKEALVLVATIRALGFYSKPEAIAPILQHLGHESGDVRQAIQQACCTLPLLPTLQALGQAYGQSLVHERNAEAGYRVRLTVLKSWEAMVQSLPMESFSVVMSHFLHALEEEQWLIRSTAASVFALLAERQKQEGASE